MSRATCAHAHTVCGKMTANTNGQENSSASARLHKQLAMQCAISCGRSRGVQCQSRGVQCLAHNPGSALNQGGTPEHMHRSSAISLATTVLSDARVTSRMRRTTHWCGPARGGRQTGSPASTGILSRVAMRSGYGASRAAIVSGAAVAAPPKCSHRPRSRSLLGRCSGGAACTLGIAGGLLGVSRGSCTLCRRRGHEYTAGLLPLPPAEYRCWLKERSVV